MINVSAIVQQNISGITIPETRDLLQECINTLPDYTGWFYVNIYLIAVLYLNELVPAENKIRKMGFDQKHVRYCAILGLMFLNFFFLAYYTFAPWWITQN